MIWCKQIIPYLFLNLKRICVLPKKGKYKSQSHLKSLIKSFAKFLKQSENLSTQGIRIRAVSPEPTLIALTKKGMEEPMPKYAPLAPYRYQHPLNWFNWCMLLTKCGMLTSAHAAQSWPRQFTG